MNKSYKDFMVPSADTHYKDKSGSKITRRCNGGGSEFSGWCTQLSKASVLVMEHTDRARGKEFSFSPP